MLRLHIPSFPDHSIQVLPWASKLCLSHCVSSFPCHEDLGHVIQWPFSSGNGPPGPAWRHVGNFLRIDGGQRSRFFGFLLALGEKRRTYWTFGVTLSDVFNWLWQARWSVTHTDTNRNALCLAFYWSLQRSQDPSIVQRVNNGGMNHVFCWLVVGIVCVGVDLLQLIPIRLLFLPQDEWWSLLNLLKLEEIYSFSWLHIDRVIGLLPFIWEMVGWAPITMSIAKVWDSYARQVRWGVYWISRGNLSQDKPNLNAVYFDINQ